MVALAVDWASDPDKRAKLRKRYGWEPKYRDVKKTIETAWRWHHAHPRGYDD